MDDYDFENPTFDPDGPGIDDDYSLDLPDAIMDPLPPRVQYRCTSKIAGTHWLHAERSV